MGDDDDLPPLPLAVIIIACIIFDDCNVPSTDDVTEPPPAIEGKVDCVLRFGTDASERILIESDTGSAMYFDRSMVVYSVSEPAPLHQRVAHETARFFWVKSTFFTIYIGQY
jgi:hypothetical protein